MSVGGYVPASFAFKNRDKVEAEAQVSPNKGLYKGYGPTAAPAAVPPKATAPATGATTPAAPATGTTAPAAH